MNQKEQIDELNSQVKLTLAPSPIDGVGVFALRDIQKGEELTEDYRLMANHEKAYPWLNESTKETVTSANSRSTWLKGRFKSFLP